VQAELNVFMPIPGYALCLKLRSGMKETIGFAMSSDHNRRRHQLEDQAIFSRPLVLVVKDGAEFGPKGLVGGKTNITNREQQHRAMDF
jgi:hypothetical protein